MPELIINQNFILSLLKISFILGAFFYLIYALVVVKQIMVMKKTLITGFSNLISLFGIIHLIIVATTLLAFIIFL